MVDLNIITFRTRIETLFMHYTVPKIESKICLIKIHIIASLTEEKSDHLEFWLACLILLSNFYKRVKCEHFIITFHRGKKSSFNLYRSAVYRMLKPIIKWPWIQSLQRVMWDEGDPFSKERCSDETRRLLKLQKGLL